MKNRKNSLYLALGFTILITVSIIMSVNSAYSYFNTKNKIIKEMKNSSRNSIISLKNNLKNLMASYAVNEYDNLIYNEISRNDIFSIVVEDYNMGKILGQKSYISGKIRDHKFNIIDYNPTNTKHIKELKSIFYSDNFYITTPEGKKLGKITIYISDEAIHDELNHIIRDTIINAITISCLLILFLFLTIKIFILKPISDMIEVIGNTDKDGIPLMSIDTTGFTEISALSHSMNTMITSIKKSRNILKTSENRLEALLNMSPIAVRIAKDKGKNVIFANNAYTKLLRMDKENTLHTNPQDYYAQKAVYDHIVDALDKDESIYNKLVELDVRGAKVWALASYMNIEFDNEDAIIGWFYDVTKQKETEVELFQALELQTRIFDNSGYLIIRTDKNGIIKQINKEAETLLGYKAEELIDKQTPELIHLESEGIEQAKNFSKELEEQIAPGFDVFVAKSNRGLINEHEWTYVTKEGKQVPVLLSVSALKDENNEIYGYLGIAKDVSQRKVMESQAKLASMGEMIGNIAHQWRQPLSAISVIASGIKVKSEYGQLDISELMADMNNITEQTQYLSHTIDDFRNFIKNTDEKNKISITQTINKVLSILNSSIINHNITVISDIEDDLIINGFQNQLMQAVINIINNAKDAINSKEDIGEKYIFITTQNTKSGLILTIKDNGGGMKEDILLKIFEPYFTTKHQSIGTGLGLSISYQIIKEHHNASIEVSNKTYTYNDKTYTGASFQITFKA